MAIKKDDEFTTEDNKAVMSTALWTGAALAAVAGIAVYAGLQG